MTAALRLSPVLLLAAALVALGAFFAHDPRPAEAQAQSSDPYTYWSATLTVKAHDDTRGCSNGIGGSFSCGSTTLTNNRFSYGNDFHVTDITVTSGAILNVNMDSALPSSALEELTLLVDGVPFPLADANVFESNLSWAESGLSWSVGDKVRLMLVRRYTPPCTTNPGNLNRSLNPRNLTVFPGDGLLTLAWDLPPTGKTYVEDMVRWRKAGTELWLNSNGAAGNETRRGLNVTHEITGLENGQQYQVQVRQIAYDTAESYHSDTGTACIRSGWVGTTATTLLPDVAAPTELTVTASGPLREGGPPTKVYFTLDHPAQWRMPAALGHAGYGWFNSEGPTFSKGATTAVMPIWVTDDSDDNNCRTLYYQVWFPGEHTWSGVAFQDEVAFTVVDDDGASDFCSGLLGSPYPTDLTLQVTQVFRYDDVVLVSLRVRLNKPSVGDTVVNITPSGDMTQRLDESGTDGDYSITATKLRIFHGDTNPRYQGQDGWHDFLLDIAIWDRAADNASLTLTATTESPDLSRSNTYTVRQLRQRAVRQSSPDAARPTAVTLALGDGNDAAAEKTVGEDAGDVTLTATLDVPAPPSGVTLRLFPGPDDTATRNADYAMPETIAIPPGERSGTVLVGVTDDALDEADETVSITAFAALFDGDLTGRAVLTITDDDTAGVTVSAASPLTVAEGGRASYTVILDSQPTADVTVTPASDDPGAATVSPASHVFTPTGWNTSATFSVSGVADTDTSDESVGISHGVTSDDALYGAVVVSTVPVTVSDTTTTEQENQEQSPQEKYADLIAKMKEWRNDPRYVHDKAHTDRWDRALLAFGETVADTTLTALTAAEAQTYADRGWTRWEEVAAALRELENQAPTVDSPIADVTVVNESATSQVSLSGVFDDADEDSLTLTAASSNEAAATVSVAADYSTLTVTAKSRGTATITVTANDGRGGTVDDTFTVTVKAAPVVSTAIGDVSGMEVFAAQEISLSGVFRDADGDSLTLSASSSDDMVVEATLVDEALTIFTLAEGTATVTVTAQDTDGNAISDAFDVSVAAQQQQQQQDPPNQAPTVSAAIGDATIVNQSGTKQVSLSGVFDDADEDSLTLTAASSDETKATVSVASDYSSLTVSAKARGTATITVTASDGKGGTVEDAFTVTVKAAPAVSTAISDVSLEEGGSQDISLSGVFSDADGDALTLSAASSDEAIVSAFEFGGTLTIVGVSAGSATVTVTAQDADGNAISDAFDVSVAAQQQQQQQDPPNQAPTVSAAIGDATIVNQSGTKQVSLSGVFDDADEDSLTLTAASSDETKATVSVASDYSSLTVSAQARGTATITVTANDSNGGTVDDTFMVTVKAAPVVASSIGDVSGLEAGTTQEVSLSGVFSDADGDALTISAASSDEAVATVTVAADRSKLTLTGVAEGSATITVTARDSDGNTASDDFTVSVDPKPEEEEPEGETSDGSPTVVSPLADISLEGPPGWENISLSGVFHDPDGDDLTITVVSSDHGVASMYESVYEEGSTLTVLAMGTGTATITVTAEDPDGNQVSDAFQVTVTPAS